MPSLANAATLFALTLLTAGPLAAQTPDQRPGGAPKSLLPDDLPDQPPAGAVEGAVSVEPEPLGESLSGFDPVEEVVAETELPELPEEEKTDPLAALAGPTGAPESAGFLTPANGGYGADLFAGSDARFLATLLGRIDAPLASRWAQIMLQRALLSRAAAPAALNPSDWVAARGAALAAMGSGADAHRLVSSISIDRYTRRLYAVAAQAALASADPMALCPLSPTARALTETPTWALADAMCLAILGDDVGATAMFDRIRREGEVSGFDIGLAERVSSATGAGRRGANPEWGEVDGLTAWRIGLASAAGLDIPDDLLGKATSAQKAWFVRLPGQSVVRRAAFAPTAAAAGAISTAEINRIFAAEAAALDPAQAGNSPGGQLRTANVAADATDRLTAMKALWSRAEEGSPEHYGWLLATAPAAARLAPGSALVEDAPAIAASLVGAGIVAPLGRWWQVADGADSDVRAQLWGRIVAVATGVPAESALFDAWAESVSVHRAQLLAAGLRGLGRGEFGADIAPLVNDWTRALDRAVANRRAGEVMVLAATGLQGGWGEVPPDYLRRIADALVKVGHAAEARLIVAEAATRG